MKLVVLFEGFFNRLNGLVNGFLIHGPQFRARWAINRHLPHRFEEFFDPVPGLEITHHPGLSFWPENTDPQKGPLCYWFVSSRCNASLEQVAEAYRHFLFRIKVSSSAQGHPLGVHYRGLHHSARTSAPAFARWAAAQATQRGIERCFAIADTARSEIQSILQDAGISVTWGKAPALRTDLDRHDAADLRAFIADALTLAECPTVLTSFAETTIVDPARAAGREVLACFGSRAWSECWFEHHLPASAVFRPP